VAGVYDHADRLTGITPASGTSATFTFDALGRFRTRVLSAGGTDTYSYLGTGEQVVRIANDGGTTTDSIIDAAGNRLGVKQASTVNWLVPDLHGSVAGGLTAAATSLTGALRYDAWGVTVDDDQPGSTGAGYFRYGGRLDISPSGTALYDLSARFYAPGLGTFTQLDSYGGEVADPRSMNRFLYAHANPATFTDPTGHRVEDCAGCGTILLANQQRASQQPSSTPRTSTTTSTGNTTGSTSTTAPHVNNSVANPCADSARCGPHTQAFGGAQATVPGCNEVLSVSGCRGTGSFEGPSTAERVIKGLGGVAYDNTLGFIEMLAYDVTHLDEIPHNLEAIATAVTHPDLTLRVAGDDLGRGIDAFGKLPLDEQVRITGDVLVAGAAGKGLGGLRKPAGALDPIEAARQGVATAVSEAEAMGPVTLTPAQAAAAAAKPHLAPMFEGYNFHQRVATILDDSYQYHYRGPDFTHLPTGIPIELTTAGQVTQHLTRYPLLTPRQIITYTRP